MSRPPSQAGPVLAELARLVFALGDQNRVTYHPDGATPETVTTHTTMLGITACTFATQYLPRLDLGRIAQYALMHDLLEAYTGDQQTLRITDAQQEAKDRAEWAAMGRLGDDFGWAAPWVVRVLSEYRQQTTAEARYLWAFDKLVPKLAHILNEGATFRAMGMSPNEVRERYADQDRQMDEMGIVDEFPELMALRRALIHDELERCFTEQETA